MQDNPIRRDICKSDLKWVTWMAIQLKDEGTAGSISQGGMQMDCTAEVELCREHQITGFPSLRVFRAGG